MYGRTDPNYRNDSLKKNTQFFYEAKQIYVKKKFLQKWRNNNIVLFREPLQMSCVGFRLFFMATLCKAQRQKGQNFKFNKYFAYNTVA